MLSNHVQRDVTINKSTLFCIEFIIPAQKRYRN